MLDRNPSISGLAFCFPSLCFQKFSSLNFKMQLSLRIIWLHYMIQYNENGTRSSSLLLLSWCLYSSRLQLCSFSLLLLLLLSRFSRVRLCATLWTAAHQAPPSLGFSRQGHWGGLPFPSPMHESEKWKWSRSVVSNSSRPHGLQPTRLLRPWDFPGKSTGVGCHCLGVHNGGCGNGMRFCVFY